MSASWQIRVYERQRLVYTADLSGPAELGRQSAAEEALYSHHPISGRWRVVIASKDEKSVSRQHALLEPLAEGGFRLTNLSNEQPVGLMGGNDLRPNAVCPVETNALLTLGTKTIRLQGPGSQQRSLQGLADPTVPPGRSSFLPTLFSGLQANATSSIEMRALVPWLHAAMGVLQSAANSVDFFDKAARALVELVNLDAGRVLLMRHDEWQTHALHAAPRVVRETIRPPSHYILDRVCQEKKTFWEVPDSSLGVAPSLEEVDAVVAAPILDRNGAVIGVLYGDRSQQRDPTWAGPISDLEAMLVELLASGVAAGLARLEQEQAALAARVRFEQFFTPELSRQLTRQPDLLEGRDAEVTILFCDIRGFSRVSEHLGPARTVEWINEVMGALSVCVRTHAGVLVDYIGDELMAMWGAPEEQPDQASLACRAALDMLDCVPKLNDRWQTALKEPMGLGIGVNTGLARVGNTGSQYKFKYGPLGNNVNLASRVQGATKYLKCNVLITGSTQAKLESSFATRRLCQVRVVNIVEPVTLHELVPSEQALWPAAKVEYEKALEAFESHDFSKAAHILGNWRVQNPSDAPALLLLYRTVQCMVEASSPFDPVWVLPGK